MISMVANAVGGVLEEASGCDDLRPGEMESTLNLRCLTSFGRTCFGMVFHKRSFFSFFLTFFFISRQDGVFLTQTLSSWVCAHDILVASLALGEGDLAWPLLTNFPIKITRTRCHA